MARKHTVHLTISSFGRGEGVVCMVLKPLEAALRNNDKVYATVSADASKPAPTLVVHTLYRF